MIHKNETLFFFKPAVHEQLKTIFKSAADCPGIIKSQFHQSYTCVVIILNKCLAVERKWPTYTNFYKQMKQTYEMYPLEFKCESTLPLY